MNNELRFIATLKDNATRQANALLAVLRRFGRNFNAIINIGVSDKATRVLNGIKNTLTGIGAGVTNIFKGINLRVLDQWASKLLQIGKIGGTLLLSANAMYVAFAAVATIIGAITLTKFAKEAVAINSSMETWAIQLQTTLGSLTAAKKEMQGIVKFAKETPFQINQITDAVVKLRAYAMDSGKWLQPLGDMAAAFGRDITDAVESAADAAQGMFRRALSYGIRMERADFKAGGKYAGMDYGEAFLKEVKKRFSGGMALQAQTFKGLVSNIKDVTSQALFKLGGGLYSQLKQQASNIFTTINTKGFQEKISKVAKVVNIQVTKMFDALKPAFNYMKTTIAPMLWELLKVSVKVAKTFTDMFSGIAGSAMKAFITPLVQMLTYLGKLVAYLSWPTKFAAAILVASIAVKSLSANVWEWGMRTQAANKIAQTEGALTMAVYTKIAKRMILLVGIMGVLNSLANRSQIGNNLKAAGDGIRDMNSAVSSGELGDYLAKLGKETNHSIKAMSDAAVEAKNFGVISKDVLETASVVAGKYNLDLLTTIDIVGEMSKNFVEFGDSSEEAKAKVKSIGEALAYVSVNAEKIGLSFDEVRQIFEAYPQLINNMAGGWKMAIAIIQEAKEQGKDAAIVFEGLNLLMTPDETMMRKLPASTWIGRQTSELKDHAKVMQEMTVQEGQSAEQMAEAFAAAVEKANSDALAIEGSINDFIDSLNEAQKAQLGFGKQASYGIKELLAVYNMAATEADGLRSSIANLNAEIQENTTIVSANELALTNLGARLANAQAELKKAQAYKPTGYKDFVIQMRILEDTANNLKLDNIKNQLNSFNSGLEKEKEALDKAKVALEEQDRALNPLRNRLQDVTNRFNKVSAAISEAQEKLDKFTHPKLEGMGAFDDKIHGIDMQLNKLNRQKLDITAGLRVYEEAGLTNTDAYRLAAAPLQAIEDQIAALENSRDKLNLDKSIAYDDQLYQLEKIGDREKEITFDTAVAGAKAAVKQLDLLEPRLKKLAQSKDALSAELAMKEQSLQRQKDIVEAQQAAYDKQKAINDLVDAQNARAQEYNQLLIDRKQLLWDMENTIPIERAGQNADMYQGIGGTYQEHPMATIAGDIFGATLNINDIQSQIDDITLRNVEINTRIANLEAAVATQQSRYDFLTATGKTLNSTFPSLIKGPDIKAFLGNSGSTLSEVLGPTYAETIASILPSKLDSIVTAIDNSAKGTGGVDIEDGKKRGRIARMWDWFQTSTIGNMILFGAAMRVMGTGRGLPTKVLKGTVRGVKSYAADRAAFKEAKAATELAKSAMIPQVETEFARVKKFKPGAWVHGQAWSGAITTEQKLARDLARPGGPITPEGISYMERTRLARNVEIQGPMQTRMQKVKAFTLGKMGRKEAAERAKYAAKKAAAALAEAEATTTTISSEMIKVYDAEDNLIQTLEKTSTKTASKSRRTKKALAVLKKAEIVDGVVGDLELVSSKVSEGGAAISRTGGTAGQRARAAVRGKGGRLNALERLIGKRGAEAVELTGLTAIPKQVSGSLERVATGSLKTKLYALLQLSNIEKAAEKGPLSLAGKGIDTELRKAGTKGVFSKVRGLFGDQRGAVSLAGIGRMSEGVEILGKKSLTGASKILSSVTEKLVATSMKSASKTALKVLGKGLLGGGALGLVTMGVDIGNFLKGDFMNERVWSKAFGGKTIQEFTKDNPVSRYMYGAFGKQNVANIFKPVGNIWDAATHASGLVSDAFSGLFNIGKGIFTGNFDSLKESVKSFGKNLVGLVADAGRTIVNQIKAIPSIGKAIGKAVKGIFTMDILLPEAGNYDKLIAQYGETAGALQKTIDKLRGGWNLDELSKAEQELVLNLPQVNKELLNQSNNFEVVQQSTEKLGKKYDELQDKINSLADTDIWAAVGAGSSGQMTASEFTQFYNTLPIGAVSDEAATKLEERLKAMMEAQDALNEMARQMSVPASNATGNAFNWNLPSNQWLEEQLNAYKDTYNSYYSSLDRYQTENIAAYKNSLMDMVKSGKMSIQQYNYEMNSSLPAVVNSIKSNFDRIWKERQHQGNTNFFDEDQLKMQLEYLNGDYKQSIVSAWQSMGLDTGNALVTEFQNKWYTSLDEIQADAQKRTIRIQIETQVKKQWDYLEGMYAPGMSNPAVGALQQQTNVQINQIRDLVTNNPAFASIKDAVLKALPKNIAEDSVMGTETVSALHKLTDMFATDFKGKTLHEWLDIGGGWSEDNEAFRLSIQKIERAYQSQAAAAKKATDSINASSKSAALTQAQSTASHQRSIDKLDASWKKSTENVQANTDKLKTGVPISIRTAITEATNLDVTPFKTFAQKIITMFTSGLGFSGLGASVASGSGGGASGSGGVTGAEGGGTDVSKMKGGPGQILIDTISDMINKATDVINYAKTLNIASPTSKTRLGMVEYAKQFLGVPYKWGGTTPKGWDCSGFVGYILSKFGIKHPRMAKDMMRTFPAVSRDHLLPGDLVFYWNGKNRYPASHVAMAIGAGKQMEAIGDTTKISKIRSNAVGYGRIPMYHGGGVTPWAAAQERIALLRGREAVVPLPDGKSIPVKLSTSGTGSSTTNVVHNNFQKDSFNFVVRDDNDIEQIKQFLVKLMNSQSGIKTTSVYNY